MTVVFVIECSAARAEIVGDRLWSIGVTAITEEATPEGRVRLRSSLGDDRSDSERRLRTALFDLDTTMHIDFEDVDDRIAESWREYAEPIEIAPGLVIAPAWVPCRPDDPSTVVVSIEPGATFGLGDHPTTRACLVALRRQLAVGDSVLDVGCGSGVLGITALRLGARTAVGLDINPAAVDVSMNNARRNGVGEHWSVTESDLDDLDVERLLDEHPEGFAIVTANILAPVLVTMAPRLRRVLGGDGTLVVSGFLSDRYDHVSAALDPLREVERVDIDGWSAVVFRHGTKESISSR